MTSAAASGLRILVVGHWDEGSGYPRTGSLLAGLRAAGFDVHECRAPQPARRGSKTELVSRPWRWPGYWIGTHRARRDLERLFRRRRDEVRPEVVLVPYPGHLAVRWVREWWDGPIVLDLFLSAWSTVVDDRRLFRPGSWPARFFARLDRLACEAADLVLLDTAQHAAMVARVTGVPEGHFDWIPVADTVDIHPTPLPARRPKDPLRVLFFGTGVPLHGLGTIVRAIERVGDVHLTLIGGDDDVRRDAALRLGARVDLRAHFVPIGDLRRAIEASHLVLGVFGTSEKARSVVPFKLVHALNHGRPVLTADTPALRGLLEPGRDCLAVPPGDESALAAELARLAADSSELGAIAARGRARAEDVFSVDALGARLASAISRRLAVVAAESSPTTAREAV